MFSALFIAALLFAPAQSVPAVSDARKVSLEAPQTIVDIDTNKMKGEPARLAWSPDGAQLFVEMVDRDGRGNVKSTKAALITLSNNSMKNIDEPPAWVGKYWLWKSSQTSPAAPSFKISVNERKETVRSTAAPTGGDLARGGTAGATAGTSLGDAASAANTAQIQTIFTLTLEGETLGEWVNQAVAPGVNFSWAPAPDHLIAYAKKDGGPLVLLDDQGHKQTVRGAKVAVLPAWSEDGTKIAWLEKKDKKHYDLVIAGVTTK
jgi:hypothetical protein